jgi:hypothetical protein
VAIIKYTCYRDGTDLTELVERARNAGSGDTVAPVVMGIASTSGPEARSRVSGTNRNVPVLLELQADDLEDPGIAEHTSDLVKGIREANRPEASHAAAWEVGVECPKENCRNIFSSQTLEVHDPNDEHITIVGRPPTDMDAYLTNAAKELGPDKSLTRASDSAKYVIANVSLVALVAGGFGIFSNAKGGFGEDPGLFGAVILLALVALIAAVVGLLPRTEDDLNSNNLVAIAAAYRSTIAYRILWARIATAALILALLAGFAVFLVASSPGPTSAISATWDGSGTRLLVDAVVASEKLPSDAHVTVALTNPANPNKSLGTITTTPGKNGTAKSEFKVPWPSDPASALITATTVWGKLEKNHHYEHEKVDRVTLTPPPFTPPPAK